MRGCVDVSEYILHRLIARTIISEVFRMNQCISDFGTIMELQVIWISGGEIIPLCFFEE